ncbi:hypothetical protein D7030_11340 [Flavobacteriaceae bacterium AU392]|nr:hypothetical protein D1817_13330 [Flavobacteriaceae bacterium]RKM82753.1 hypothetical protein D7030_11340 [Flavobacteriaceae bacterium AU392]
MFNQLLRFEAQYQLKQRAFLLFSALFLFLGFQLGRQGYGRGTTIYNTSQAISEITGIFTLGSVFIIMFFVISGVLRDKQFNMHPIIFSTSIKKRYYFLSRFLGVFAISTMTFSFFLIGFAITTLLPNLDPELVNPLNIAHYLWTLLIIVLPNIFISSSIIFSVSILTKNNVATYVSAIVIYVLYFICSIFLNSPIMAQSVPASAEGLALAALFDPFGISAMFEQTQFWTLFQKNTQSLVFSGYFMWNRILWLSISLLILFTTYKLFSFRIARQKVKKVKTIQNKSIKKRIYQSVKVSINRKSNIKAFITLLNIELKNVFRSLPFIGVMILWVVIVITEIYSRIVEGGEYNDSLYPFTNLLMERLTEPLFVLGIILVIFYSGEVVWRERNLNFNGLVDVTPTSNSAFYLSKFVTLLLLPAFLILSGILVSIGFQISRNYYNFELIQYLSLFYNPGITFVFYSLLALFVQSIVRNKYIGMGITGLIIILFGTQFSSLIGIEHPLLLIGKLPGLNYTNMNGFNGITKQYNHLSMYWLAFGTILLFLSFKLWKRGTISSTTFKVRQVISNWSKRDTIIGVCLLIMFLSFGTMTFYNTNIVTTYRSSQDVLDYREAYERKFKKYEHLEGLFPVDISTKIDLYPENQSYRIAADYILTNKNTVGLNQLFITEREPLKSIRIENTTLIEHDTVFGTYLFQFNETLQPQDSIQFEYVIEKEYKGYESGQELVENGTYLMYSEFEPVLEYRNGFEITNSKEREKRGLPVRKEIEVSDTHIQNTDSYIGRVNYEALISTENDQTAIALGILVKQWNSENRNYFHYKSNEPVIPTIGYFSAKYDQSKAMHNGITIEQYYHPDHNFNLERITESTKQTLDYCITNFGDYPFDHIRIAEIPSHWGFGGFAHPGTISMVEDRLHLVDLRNVTDFDLVAKRTIHEVAHQWFGHILSPKNVDGGSILVEGLAKYAEAVVMDQMYGKSAIWQLSKTANELYFRGRSFETEYEPPLYQVSGQSYLSYGKTHTVLLALRDLIGEDKINIAIKNMVNKHKKEIGLHATSIEFLEELYKVAPQAYHTLIDDWFKRVITYDLSVESSSYKQLNNGTYEVSIKVDAKRFQQQNNGDIKEVTMDEPIQIGVFAAHPGNVKKENVLYLKSHRINKNQMEFKIIVDEQPTHIAIDPFGSRSDEDYTDNILSI